jgi:hypothetical protein
MVEAISVPTAIAHGVKINWNQVIEWGDRFGFMVGKAGVATPQGAKLNDIAAITTQFYSAYSWPIDPAAPD